MSKHKQWSLRPNQMINLNKKFSDLKEKQKAKIADWLYIETYRFYKEHNHMPNHSERQAVLDTVYGMIESAEIWIPYKEVERYYPQGYFSIENRDEQTPWKKKVRVVTSVEYYLKN